MDPRIEQLGKLQKQLTVEPLVAPHSRSITPRPGELPPSVLNRDRTGYIALQNASAEEIGGAGLTVKDRGFDGLQVSV